MDILLFSCAVLILPLGGGFPPTARVADTPEFVVVPEVTSLKVGDPLIVKAILRNSTRDTLRLERPFDAGWVGVTFEISPSNDDAFVGVYVYNQGLMCGHFRRPIEVKAGQSIAAHERMFPSRAQRGVVSVISKPGTWRLRAVTNVSGQRIHSPAVSIEVRSQTPQAQAAWANHFSSLSHVAWFGSHAPHDDLVALVEVEKSLVGSNAALTIARARRLVALRNAIPLRQRQDAMEALTRFREDLSPMAREYLDLQIADVLVDRKEYGDAEALLKTIQEDSNLRRSVVARLESHDLDRSIPAPRLVKP